MFVNQYLTAVISTVIQQEAGSMVIQVICNAIIIIHIHYHLAPGEDDKDNQYQTYHVVHLNTSIPVREVYHTQSPHFPPSYSFADSVTNIELLSPYIP